MVQARKTDPAVEKSLTEPGEYGKVLTLAEHRVEREGVARAARFSIRDCTFQDIDDCIVLGKEMHRESAYSNIPFSDTAVRALLEVAILSNKYRALVVRDIEGEMIGMCLFFSSQYYFSTNTYVQDMCSYVVPTWRGSTVFLRMLALITQWSKNIGALELVLGTTTKVDTEKFESVLERLQFERVGAVFKQSLKVV